jgi:hypothetical protein
MPSNLHEWLLELFRHRSATVAELLRTLDVPLPEHDAVRIEMPNVNSLRPVEYVADLVLFLARGSRYVFGIIVEVQLSRDEDKPYVWPVYVANLRARHRCPVGLLVITVEDSIARWAARSIDLGPAAHCTPWVIGPSNTPAVTEIQAGRENVELAVFSAIQHGPKAETELAKQVVATAVTAARDIDNERTTLYLDFIFSHLKDTPQVLEEAMSSLEFKYQSDFARRYVAEGLATGKAEGLAEGAAEGRAEIILEQLATRFGPLPDSIRTRVRGATAAQLHAVAKRLLTAQSLEEALESI